LSLYVIHHPLTAVTRHQLSQNLTFTYATNSGFTVNSGGYKGGTSLIVISQLQQNENLPYS